MSVSMMLQRFVATSSRNGLKIKSSHAGDWPVAATSSYSEIGHCVKHMEVVVLMCKLVCSPGCSPLG